MGVFSHYPKNTNSIHFNTAVGISFVENVDQYYLVLGSVDSIFSAAASEKTASAFSCRLFFSSPSPFLLNFGANVFKEKKKTGGKNMCE